LTIEETGKEATRLRSCFRLRLRLRLLSQHTPSRVYSISLRIMLAFLQGHIVYFTGFAQSICTQMYHEVTHVILFNQQQIILKK